MNFFPWHIKINNKIKKKKKKTISFTTSKYQSLMHLKLLK